VNQPRFILIGGFLGAGKTTTIARLAHYYQSQGKRVGIVTNDQATDLVDTNSLRSQGFDVGEVAGACFCCNFNELTSAVEQLESSARPDVLLAEPVGSCTDLVATVIRPLVQIYDSPLEVAPYGVILKPSHGARILRGEKSAGFSPKAEYIFRKQIEEADFVVLNRIDELPAAEVNQLAGLIEEQFPGRPVLRMSARTGEGFSGLCEFLQQRGNFGTRVMELDYDVYAEGEAELGWLNSQATLTAREPFELDRLLLSVITRLRDEMETIGAETAHLKAIGLWEGFYGVANLVVNARVATDPDELARIVRQVVAAAAAEVGATATIDTLQSFRPGRPVPTHRIITAS
jgi:G3E family GTPase